MTSLMVFDVQHFCYQDGPGIRTTVFTKGCSLRCQWCHNPESLHTKPEILYYQGKCISCGICVSACPIGAHVMCENGHVFLRGRCNACGACVALCPSRALEVAGQNRTVADLLDEVLRDIAVYDETGGGVTISGGEPLLHPHSLKELLLACKDNGVHTAVDTSGNVPEKSFSLILQHTDLFLYDMKTASSSLHEKATGSGNEQIRSNLEYISSHFKGEVWIRIPVIPGINDNIDEMSAIADFLRTKPVSRIELLAYHDIGIDKYQALGIEYRLPDTAPPEKASMQSLRKALSGDWTVV